MAAAVSSTRSVAALPKRLKLILTPCPVYCQTPLSITPQVFSERILAPTQRNPCIHPPIYLNKLLTAVSIQSLVYHRCAISTCHGIGPLSAFPKP